MKDFRKNLNLFLYGTEEGKNETPTEEIKQKKSPQSISGSASANPVNIPTGTDYDKSLDDDLEAANQDGADFFEFQIALNKMSSKPISEQEKYDLIFPAYESQGMTAEKLVASAEYYLGILNNSKQRFTDEWEEAFAQQVTVKKELMENITLENIELNKKIQENNIKAQKLNEEVFNSTNVLNNEKMGMENKWNYKASLINERITKIKTYLYAKVSK